MDNVLGIITEYNPFHNGHLYHLLQSKKITNSDYSIAIISGNFTQRGEPSLIDKWSKAQAAIDCGVDLVIELPVLYSTSSAEGFAEGAVKILDSLKIVNFISFGEEVKDISILNDIAEILYKEPKKYKSLLSHELSKGLSFPKARENALMLYLNDIRKYSKVLSQPNNILGIEYLKALKKLNSPIQPYSIQRVGSDYNDIRFTGNIASATAIRKMFETNDISKLSSVIPHNSYNVLYNNISNGHVVTGLYKYEKEIIYTLRKMSLTEITNLPDVSEGLENAIKNAANSCNTMAELMNKLSSKRYTKTRIQRILVYALLGITKSDMQNAQKIAMPYARVLGFNENGKKLLSEINKANPKLNIITSVKKFVDSNPLKNMYKMLEKDIWATDVYTLGYEYDSVSNLDYTHKIIH